MGRAEESLTQRVDYSGSEERRGRINRQRQLVWGHGAKRVRLGKCIAFSKPFF